MSKKFNKKFLSEVLGFNEEETKLIMKAQRQFPSILAEDGQGFCLDGRMLHSELGVLKAFSTWIKTNLENVDAKEGKDYIENWINDKGDSFQGIPENTKVTDLTGMGYKKEYKLTLNIAKEICMVTGLGNKTGEKLRENSKLIRKYFILLEKAIKGMQEHLIIREPEKAGYNEMKKHITNWYIRNNPDKKINPYIYANDADMLNITLLGKRARDIKKFLEFEDNNTREHLKIEVNKALYELQMLNSALLIANIDYEQRKSIVEATCLAKYDNLKLEINKELDKNINK